MRRRRERERDEELERGNQHSRTQNRKVLNWQKSKTSARGGGRAQLWACHTQRQKQNTTKRSLTWCSLHLSPFLSLQTSKYTWTPLEIDSLSGHRASSCACSASDHFAKLSVCLSIICYWGQSESVKSLTANCQLATKRPRRPQWVKSVYFPSDLECVQLDLPSMNSHREIQNT